ncbi:HET domain-containing protein [Verticillium dahliae]
MAERVTYDWKLTSRSVSLPFRLFGKRFSAGVWVRRTEDKVVPPQSSLLDASTSVRDARKYEYQPIPEGRCIRVLKLHAGVGNEPLYGTLSNLALIDDAEYEALSYVWGANLDANIIFLQDNRILSLGGNLADALYSLRHKKKDRVLWIDALCIDQENLEEKSSQIPLMAEIYAMASSVVVWLGKPTAHSQTGLDILAFLAGSDKFDDNAPWNRMEIQDVIAAIRDIIDRHYFQRLWVVQEAALAQRVALNAGHLMFEWTGGLATRRFLARIKLAELSPTWQKSDLKEIDFRPLRELLEQSLAAESRRNGRVELPSLLDVAHSIRNRQVTDHRDRIYGVMSLVTPAQVAGFVPDYTKSWEETYLQFYDLVERQVLEDPTIELQDVLKHEQGGSASA